MEPDDALRKRARASGAGGGSSAGGPDRLSSLPDRLLHTIMSFLKARQAVQTCVLSTRWRHRHLWRSVPCLDIDFDEFNNKAPSGSDIDTYYSDGDSSSSDIDTYYSDDDTYQPSKYKDWEDFEHFVANLMTRCNNARLDSFRLCIVRSRAPMFSEKRAAGWLYRAMKYITPNRASMPGLSSSSWLLKRLHLCQVHLDNHFMERVSSVCCSLEDLELDKCTCEIQSITSDSLKTLVLKKCRWRNLSEIISPTLKTLVIDGGSNNDACVLVIMAPALAYLHLAVDVYRFCAGVSLNAVPSVGKAFIHLKGHDDSIFSRSKLDGDQFNLLCSISNSINLELSGVGKTVIGREPSFQEFKNLRNLLLDHCDLSDDFRTLVFFLRGSPILEKLTLRHCKFPNPSKKKRIPIRSCLSSFELPGLDLLCKNLKVEII